MLQGLEQMIVRLREAGQCKQRGAAAVSEYRASVPKADMHTHQYLTAPDLDLLQRVLDAFAPDASADDRDTYALLLVRWFQDGVMDQETLFALLDKFAGRDVARAIGE